MPVKANTVVLPIWKPHRNREATREVLRDWAHRIMRSKMILGDPKDHPEDHPEGQARKFIVKLTDEWVIDHPDPDFEEEWKLVIFWFDVFRQEGDSWKMVVFRAEPGQDQEIIGSPIP